MTEKEKTNFLKKVNALLASCDLKTKRQILWELLEGSITEDAEGIKWLYFQLEKFINSEFGN
jgi:hypothetical protein